MHISMFKLLGVNDRFPGVIDAPLFVHLWMFKNTTCKALIEDSK